MALGTVSLIQGVANATTSPPSFAPDATGTWCFRAEYSGDANNAPSSDGSSGECFSVGAATASVVSTPAAPTATPTSGDSDQVTVTGNGVGGNPSGTVSFFVCGPLSSAFDARAAASLSERRVACCRRRRYSDRNLDHVLAN